EAGLSAFVEFRVGDALQLIADAPETFDFVLVDLWKDLYVPCLELFFAKLNSGAWVIADNMIYPPHDQPVVTAYRNRIKETAAFDTLLLPIGSGIEVSQRK
ncbi:MAG: methyltransferase, partial [Flavisolibacter sp.]|nr:methyltransferase [Flavisolibacter sp.]